MTANRTLTVFLGAGSGRVLDQLPERTRQAIRENQVQAEILIACVQLALVTAFALLYVLAPQATMRTEPHFEPLLWVLGVYAIVTSIRLALAYYRALGPLLLALSVVIDLGLLMALIWGFHIQYAQPPAFYLKVPTLLTSFIFIALRALRFEVRYVVLAGISAAVGWACLVAYAVIVTPDALVVRDFVGYMTGNRILIGAEVEKILDILAVTAVLALAITRARRLLVRAAVDGAAARDLARFFDPNVAERIRGADQPLRAGEGEARDAAILFLDIRGFTRLSSELAPSALMALLTEYHARLVPLIQHHGGTIDKFMGDGILATFGAAQRLERYAAAALEAIDAVMEEAKHWQREREERGERALRINAGVAVGRIVFGAVGDERRLEYTVIGGTVNLAAKLEKHNKLAGSNALATADTLDRALAQGYRPPHSLERRPLCRVADLAEPIDLVALA
ncbi:MAG TPA: adenylate/guanylate cyclase domain-containing protein [Stellaceae bacterium]|nr:adenylate/guanylate cyclase domain-containing protein [Stellaceae bacterium]